MMNAISNEAVHLRFFFLFMVKKVGSKKPWLLIVPLLVTLQSFAVAVKEKTIVAKVKMSRIPPHHLGSGLFLWRVICRYRNRQTAFNF